MKQFLRILIDNLSMENRDNILKKEETHIKNNLIISNQSIGKNAIHFNRVVIEHPAKIFKYIEEYDEGLVENANIIHIPNHLKAEERKGFIKKYKYRNILI